MTIPASHQVLRRVVEASKIQLAAYKEGVYLTTTSGWSIDDLRHEATSDRMELARHFLGVGDKLLRVRPAQHRSAISRYYYCMYHALRAVVFFQHEGDDHESHSALPGHVPKDFPNSAVWSNDLKSARENRNSADYDPYPPAHTSWQAMAKDLGLQAPSLLAISEAYLRGKGCKRI